MHVVLDIVGAALLAFVGLMVLGAVGGFGIGTAEVAIFGLLFFVLAYFGLSGRRARAGRSTDMEDSRAAGA